MLHQTLTLLSSSSSSPLPLSPSSSHSSHSSDISQWEMEPVEDFSVDDLLNLNEEEEEEEEAEEKDESLHSNSSSSDHSAVSFEEEAAPPPPPPAVAELALPAHDASELEWVSRIVDDTQTEYPPLPKLAGCQPAPPVAAALPVKEKRSKRARSLSASWSSSGGDGQLQLLADDVVTSSSSVMTVTTSSTSSSSSYSSSRSVFDEIPAAELKKQKKRGRKPKESAAGGGGDGGGERRCRHCGVNKTPQWRTGPMGAKTLCNACGVRYKSGRLLPEYRPACSPTFVSHVHSNSHRKVLEMRRKKDEEEQKLLAF